MATERARRADIALVAIDVAATASRPPSRPGNALLDRKLLFEVSLRSILKLLLVVGALWLTIKLFPVLLVGVCALFVVGTLNPSVEWLEARKVRRPRAIALVFMSILLAAVALGVLTVPPLLAQIGNLFDMEPTIRAKLVEHLARIKATAPLADSLRASSSGTIARAAAAMAVRYSSSVLEVFAFGLSTLFLALYLMIDRDRARGALFAVVPRTHHLRLTRVLLNMETIVGGYIRGQLITSALMALVVFLLLTACGVENAIAIGVFAGIVDVLPYVGVLLVIAPAVVATIPHGTTRAIVVLVVLLVYSEVESRVLVPRIYGRALRLPASAVLFALLAGGTLMGVGGALLALPIAAAIRMLVEELRIALPGEDVDDHELREKDEMAEREYAERADGVPAKEAAAIAVEIAVERHEEESVDPEKAAEVPITGGDEKGP